MFRINSTDEQRFAALRLRRAVTTMALIGVASTSLGFDGEEASVLGPGAYVRLKRVEPKFASIEDGKLRFDFSERERGLDDKAIEEYEYFKRQQAYGVTHKMVIHSIMKRRELREMPFFKEEKEISKIADRIRDAIEVDFLEGLELMRIRVRARDREEAAMLANIVKQQYLNEWVEVFKQEKLFRFAALEKRYESFRQRYLKEKARLAELERSYGRNSPTILSPEVEAERDRAEAVRVDVQQKAAELAIEINRTDLKIELFEGRMLSEAFDGKDKPTRAEIDKLGQHRKKLQHDLDFYVKQFKKLAKPRRRINEYSDDIEVRRERLALLKATVDAMQLQLYAMELNMQATPRIEDYADASVDFE